MIIDKMAEINKDVDIELDLVPEALRKLRNIMKLEHNGTTTRLFDFFQFCAGANTTVVSSPTLVSSATDASVPFTASNLESTTEITSTSTQQEHENYEGPWLNVTSLDECNETHRKFKKYIDDVILIPYGHIKDEQIFFVMAEKYNHSVNGSGPLKYPECFDLIEKGKAIMDFFNAVLHLTSQVVEVDIGEGLNTLEELIERLEDVNLSESVKYFNTRLNQSCGWRKDFSEIVREKAEMYKEYITHGRLSLLQLETILLRYYGIVMLWDWELQIGSGQISG